MHSAKLNGVYFKPTQAGEAIGNGVLIQVFHTLLFGEGIPEKFSRPPPGGYSVVDVVTTITLVCILKIIQVQSYII